MLVSEPWPPPESRDPSVGRFHLVQKTGQACTALAFNLRRTTELLVALADHTIKCFDKGRIDTSAHPFVLVATVLPSRRFFLMGAHYWRSLLFCFHLSCRHKGDDQLDAGSWGSSVIHLCAQLRTLCYQHISGHSAALGPGHVSEEAEAHCQTACWYSEGKHGIQTYKWRHLLSPFIK